MNLKPSIKTLFKRFIISIVVLLLLVILSVVIFYENGKERILEEVQQYVSEIQSGDLEIEEINLALFSHLPNITIRLKNIDYYERKDSVRENGEKPILSAENLNLAFEFWPLIRNGNLIVSTVSIERGHLHLFEYQDKTLNFQKALAKPVISKPPQLGESSAADRTPKKVSTNDKPQTKIKKELTSTNSHSSFELDLKEIQLRDITISYSNPAEQQSSQLDLGLFDGKLKLNPHGVSVDLISSMQITKSEKLPGLTKLGNISLAVNLEYIDSVQQIIVNKGTLSVEEISIDIKGSYSHNQEQAIDFVFDASSNDLVILSKLIQEDVLSQNKTLIQNADVDLKGRVYGELVNRSPKLDLRFSIKNLSLVTPNGKGKLDDIGFEGEFHTGDSADYSTAMITISNLRGQMPGGSISGSFMLQNFLQPYLKYDLNASLQLDGYDDIFQLPEIDSLQGGISVAAKFDGVLNFEDKHVMDSSGSFELDLQEIGFNYIGTNKRIRNLNGNISEVLNEIIIRNLQLNYDSSNIAIDGKIKNLYHIIFSKEKNLEADLEITSSQLFTNHFIQDEDLVATIDDRLSDLSLKVNMIGGDNDNTDNDFPLFTFQIEQLSFDLDKLPSIPMLAAQVKIFKTEKGLKLALSEVHIDMPDGIVDANGEVLIANDLETLEIEAKVSLNNIPDSYIKDLIKEMQADEILDTKTIEPEEVALLSSELDVAMIMDIRPFALRKLDLRNSDISIRQADTLFYRLENMNLKLNDLYFRHAEGSNQITGIESITCDIDIASIDIPAIKNGSINLSISGANDVFDAKFSTLRNLIAEDDGVLFLDVSQDTPIFKLIYSITNVPIEYVIKEYYPQKFIEGRINASIELSGIGNDWNSASKTMKGTINISGDSLIVYGIDIDDVLKKYERSQNFNLADLGAVMLAGPFGAAITKGSDFSRLANVSTDNNQKTSLPRLLAKWKIQDGLLEAEDVAFTTATQRLAFSGVLDFVNDTIPGYTVYVLDEMGCSLMEQRLYGKMDNIQMGKLKIAKTLFGSVINFLNAVVGKDCKPVYNGSVKHPN